MSKHPSIEAVLKGSGIPPFKFTGETKPLPPIAPMPTDTLTAKTQFVEDVPEQPVNHYERTHAGVKIDYYDICDLYEITDSAVGHALKKLLRFGRGQHKGRDQDIAEAIQSLRRWQEKEAAKTKA